ATAPSQSGMVGLQTLAGRVKRVTTGPSGVAFDTRSLRENTTPPREMVVCPPCRMMMSPPFSLSGEPSGSSSSPARAGVKAQQQTNNTRTRRMKFSSLQPSLAGDFLHPKGKPPAGEVNQSRWAKEVPQVRRCDVVRTTDPDSHSSPQCRHYSRQRR